VDTEFLQLTPAPPMSVFVSNRFAGPSIRGMLGKKANRGDTFREFPTARKG
jgi:hypothetical protein